MDQVIYNRGNLELFQINKNIQNYFFKVISVIKSLNEEILFRAHVKISVGTCLFRPFMVFFFNFGLSKLIDVDIYNIT